MRPTRATRWTTAALLAAALCLPSRPAPAGPPQAAPPVEMGDVHLHVLRTEVESAEGGWETVQEEERLFALDALIANMNAVLGPGPFPVGAYEGLRLILGDGSYVAVVADGETRRVPLSVPSGRQTGLKIEQPFEVVLGKLLQLEVRFDETALRHQRRRDLFVLRPTCLTLVGVEELDAVAGVGPQGGSLTTLDGRLELSVPPGALERTETLSIRRLAAADTPPAAASGLPFTDRLGEVGPAYELTARDDLELAVPATLLLRYDADEVALLDEADVDTLELHEAQLAVHRLDEASGRWRRLDSVLDPDADTVSVELDHFSKYRLLANAYGRVIGIDDLEPVDSTLQQGGGFGPTQAIGSIGHCSGFLVSHNLFMTNYHCLTGGWCKQAGASAVTFNRILDPLNSVQAGEPESFICAGPRLLLPHLDVVVVELAPDPGTGRLAGEVWGFYNLDPGLRDVRTYSAGYPADRVLSPDKLWIDFSPGCGIGFLSPLEDFFWQPAELRHGCDTGPGSDGSPLVDFADRNRVIGIHSGVRYGPFYLANVGTFMGSVLAFDDVNGNSVLDIVEIDLTGGLTDVGFRTCVEALDGPCFLRWFLPYRIEFTARGGVPPYTWSASDGFPISSDGVLEGGPPLCLCDIVFDVTVTDSLGISTTRTVVLRSGL